jgi:glycosyltransferase involved in cell wall biosynthesis
MKIIILFSLKKNMPAGGGNQFLNALAKYFTDNGCYTEDIEEADVVLFNSYQYIRDVAQMKKKYPSKIFVHRIDGPIRLYNNANDRRDFITNAANRFIADATIFQSNWSQIENFKLGLHHNDFETIIINAPDPILFNRIEKLAFSLERKINLIATSWSPNWNKGFKTYQWIDSHLNFNRYNMTFVGRSPVRFNNIREIPALPSQSLAEHLKCSDIFITASSKDPCSNSLIEALHCGLPALAYNDGGHPDILGAGGICFDIPEEIPARLERLIQNYGTYQSQINVPSLNSVGKKYSNFIESIVSAVRVGKHVPKKLSPINHLKILAVIEFDRFSGIIASAIQTRGN